jgi:hypothetical protein
MNNHEENNDSINIVKLKRNSIKIIQEKEQEENFDFLNKKRKRFNIKRGSNCSWTIEEVKNKSK